MSKLVIQLPCWNEEETLPTTLRALPQSLEGIQRLEWLVIDDGSDDKTQSVAEKSGVHHFVKMDKHEGLGRAFQRGLIESLNRGFDIIVNTDADNQYCAEDIGKLLAPILDGSADVVIGCRPLCELPNTDRFKNILYTLIAKLMYWATGYNIPDPTSGFRAYKRSIAEKLNLSSKYSYTLESIFAFASMRARVKCVSIRVNDRVLRPSRLMSSLFSYSFRSAGIFLRSFWQYKIISIK